MSSKFSTKLKTTAAKPCKSKPTPALPPQPPPPTPWPPDSLLVEWSHTFIAPDYSIQTQTGTLICPTTDGSNYENTTPGDPDYTAINVKIDHIANELYAGDQIYISGEQRWMWTEPFPNLSPPVQTYNQPTVSDDPHFLSGWIQFTL